MAPASLSLLLLGPFQATLAGRPILGFESGKARALLAYLAVETERPHRRRHLADLLWPQLSEPAALANLRHALANVRRLIGDQGRSLPFLLADHSTVQFRPNADLYRDIVTLAELVAEKEIEASVPKVGRLEQAVQLYRGDFLEDLVLDGCEAFEEWVLVKRERFSRLLMAALNCLCECYEREGRYGEVERCARQLVEREPWDEAGYQHLMRCLALAGHRAEALQQYERCREVLGSAMGIEPGSDMTALYAAIRDGELLGARADVPPMPVALPHPQGQTRAQRPERRSYELLTTREAQFALDM